MKDYFMIGILIWISLVVTTSFEKQKELRKGQKELLQKVDSLSNQVNYLTNLLEDNNQF